jgi:type IV fimbrial biogenesis protein FimT
MWHKDEKNQGVVMNHSIREEVSCHGLRAMRAAGMTLAELLVALAIAAIMLTLAVPSFNDFLQGNRFATFSNTYLTHLHLARSEASKRSGRVALCKSANGSTCATSGGWQQGWIVFHDANNNAQADTGEEILRVNEALPTNWSLRGNTPVANYVSYAATGGAKTTSGALQLGTLTLCRESTESGEARAIVVSSTGRPRVEKTIAASCP